MRAGADALFNVLECAIAWDVQRVTVASTIGVYGGVPDLRGVGEELPLQMTAGGNVVAASKKSAELVVSLFRERGVEAISVRLPAVWGPRGRKESRFFAAPGLIHAAVSGESAPTAYADDAIDMLYVKDCARAIALLETADRLAHSIYNVGSGRATSNAEWWPPSSAPSPAPSYRSSPAGAPKAKWPTWTPPACKPTPASTRSTTSTAPSRITSAT
jgi:UDP-glucose 4-epimerase